MLTARNTALSLCERGEYALLKLASGKANVDFLIDSGSDAHITSSKCVFVPGSVKKCSVNIIGITGDRNRVLLHADESGDVMFRVSSDRNVMLRNVLFVPNAVLSDDSECTVLISVHKLALQCGVSTRFDMNEILFYESGGDVVLGKYSSDSDRIYIVSHTSAAVASLVSNSDAAVIMNDESERESVREKEKKNDDENVMNMKDEMKDETSEMIQKEKGLKVKRKRKGVAKKNQSESRRRGGSSLPRKEREALSRRLHNRMHFGKTKRVRKFLKDVYGDDLIFLDDEPCDACMWSKARFKPRPTSSHRKAKRVGERLHFDVFTSSIRSDDGCKYLLVIVDEFSGYIWAYGMRRKSETRGLIQLTIRRIEKKLSKLVRNIDYSDETSDLLGVSSLRCDNAGENVLGVMKKWCSKRGTSMETSIPHTPWQDGRAERMGGVVWQGGASLRYGGNLPDSEWLRCCLAFVHIRNRLPSAACKHPTLPTPYEAYNDVAIPACELIEHFRRLGCVCHVVVPHSARSGKPKKTFRAMLVGYSEEVAGKKGYLVRNLSTGVIEPAAFNQVHCFESTLCYPASLNYDAWLNKRIKAIAEKEKKEEARKISFDKRVVSDDDSDSDDSDHDDNNDSDTNDNDTSDDDDSLVLNEPNASDSDEDDEMLKRLEKGVPISSPPRPPTTRSAASNSKDASIADAPPPLSPTRYNPLSSAVRDSESEIEVVEENSESQVSDSDSQISRTSEEEAGGEFEIVGIRQSRRKGRGVQYQAEWKKGELTWEPKRSFFDADSNSYLPVFDLFNENEKKGIVGARASDCDSELSDSEDEEIVSGGSAAGEGTGAADAAGASDAFQEAGTADVAAEGSREAGECENSSYTSSADSNSSDSVTLEHIALAISTARSLITLEKAGVVVPESRREAIAGKHWKQFKKAELRELMSFLDLDVWELVRKPKGANIVGTRWVYDVKVNTDGSIERFKARLVAQGFSQKEGIDFTETFAPTMHTKTARVLLALAARHNIEVRKYDVSTAFLHANLDEDVFVQQPPGHVVEGKEKWVYKLKKAMYGLKNAPKAYSDHFMGVLSELGFKQSTRDSCLWSLFRGSYFVHYLFHVDDILVVSNHNAMREACFSKLEKKLLIRDEGVVKMFLGIEIDRLSDGSYTMCQTKYIERLAKRFCIDDMSRPVETPGLYGQKLSVDDLPNTDEKKREASELPFQELVGALLYVTKTRPDVAYAVSDISRFMSKWGSSHFKAALRVLRYLYSTRESTYNVC